MRPALVVAAALGLLTAPAVAGPAQYPFWGSPLYVEVVVVGRADYATGSPVETDAAFDTDTTNYNLEVVGTPVPAPDATKVLELPAQLGNHRLGPWPQPRRAAFANGQRLVILLLPATQSMCGLVGPCEPPDTNLASAFAVMDTVVVASHEEALALLERRAVEGWPTEKPEKPAKRKRSHRAHRARKR